MPRAARRSGALAFLLSSPGIALAVLVPALPAGGPRAATPAWLASQRQPEPQRQSQEPQEPQPAAPQAPGAGTARAGRDAEAKAEGSGTEPAGGASAPAKKVLVLRAGTVHPVSGPPIQDGVIVIEGDRIRAVGAAGQVEVPANAEVRRFPDAHAWPGLIDARSTAFADRALLQDPSTDAGSEMLVGLDPFAPRAEEVVAAGVTTALVASESQALFGGKAALIRPGETGFRPFPHRSEPVVRLRLTAGSGNTHPLQRQKEFARVTEAFEQLADYAKKLAEHEKQVQEYETKYREYLDWHRRRQAARTTRGDGGAEIEDDGGGEAANGPAGARAERGEGRGEGNRGGGPPGDPRRGRRGPGGQPNDGGAGDSEGQRPVGRRPQGQEPGRGESGRQEPDGRQRQRGSGEGQDRRGGERQAQGPQGPGPGQQGGGPGQGRGAAAPKKPEYPKPPAREPGKDALLAVQKGELTLLIEAHRDDEIEAALRLVREQKIPRAILECRRLPARFAAQVRNAGLSVVLTDVQPGAPPAPGEEVRDRELPARLEQAQVPFAIASGSADAARFLPLLAAAACGEGASAEAAVRAVTLTPARMLGIDEDVGSLEAGKLADVLLTTEPLLASDARVVAVFSGGEAVYERSGEGAGTGAKEAGR